LALLEKVKTAWDKTGAGNVGGMTAKSGPGGHHEVKRGGKNAQRKVGESWGGRREGQRFKMKGKRTQRNEGGGGVELLKRQIPRAVPTAAS